MSELRRYLRRRSLLRGTSWIAVISLVLCGLWIANRVLPSPVHRPPSGTPSTAPRPVPEGRVETVLDGDSLRLAGGIEVRLKGIDTPERGQPGSEQAREALRGLVLGKEVRLDYGKGDKSDRYGRLLAFLALPSSGCVNEELLRSGLAWTYKLDRASDRREPFLNAQREAMDARRGIWGMFSDCEGPFIGNRSSRVFHKPGCRFGSSVSPKNREAFESLRRAFWEGYSPCRQCLSQPLEGF